MYRYRMIMVFALAGVLSTVLFSFTITAQEREKFTDFRGRTYSVEDLEKALFPEAGPQGRMRGIAPQQPQQPPPEKVALGLNVFFEFNSDKILAKYYDDLDKLGAVLARYPEEKFQLEGHTDSIGSASYNQELSERRAESVKQYLMQHATIAPERLVVRGHGKNQPRATNDTEEGRSMNRRVELVRGRK